MLQGTMQTFICYSCNSCLTFSKKNSLHRLYLARKRFRKDSETKFEVFFKLPVVEVLVVVVNVRVVVGVVFSVTST